MKEIRQKDIEQVKMELAMKRIELDNLELNLEERLEWIRVFFLDYVPKLEKRFMSKDELNTWVFLPDELRIWFYMYFPEHGLNAMKLFEALIKEIAEDAEHEAKFILNRE